MRELPIELQALMLLQDENLVWDKDFETIKPELHYLIAKYYEGSSMREAVENLVRKLIQDA